MQNFQIRQRITAANMVSPAGASTLENRKLLTKLPALEYHGTSVLEALKKAVDIGEKADAVAGLSEKGGCR